MRYLPLILFSLFAQNLTSQNFEIIGNLLNEKGEPLESATLYVEKIADSSLITYTVSENDGSFILAGKTEEKEVKMVVSYSGFKPIFRQITIKESINMGNVAMEVENNTLDEIIIIGDRAPVILKKDTLEFNADSFTTRPNANLEELLKQLPGVEVDTDGNITVNGIPVSRFLVNGKEFFGSDHRIATKNLPKEIINKIQVVDSKTQTQEFTGEAGDPDNKTINITIKKDKNKGYFTRATAGGGTNERYELSGIGNYFKDDLRVSVLAGSNNINSSGFSYDEVYGMMGRSAISSGGGRGITKSETAGLNVVNEWEEEFGLHELGLSVDYFFGRNDTERSTQIARENILPQSRYFTNSDDRSNLVNDSHRATVRLEVEFDTLTRLSVTPRINANFGNSYRSRREESLDEDQNLINNSENMENEQLERKDFSNNIDFIKRFGSRGALIGIEFSHDHSSQRNDNFYYSESMFFEEGEVITKIQDQFIDEDENEQEYTFQMRQRSVLADRFFLNLSYNFNHSNSTNKRYVYEAENGDGNYTSLNNLLSNDFEVTNKRHRPNMELNYNGETWRVNANFGLQHTNLENINFFEETSFDNTYNNFLMNARVRYAVERSKNLSLRYNSDVNIPSLRQLQPVIDRTNPLRVIVGNPGLMPTYRHRINFEYRNFNFATKSGFDSNFNLNLINNNVVSVTTVDDDLVRHTTYANVNGSMNASAGTSFNKQIKEEVMEFRYRLRLNASYNKNIGFTNAVKYIAERYSLTPSIRLTYAIEDLFDINPNYSLSYNNSRYDINSNRNREVVNHRISLEATSYWPENLIFGNDISYNYNGNVSPGFDNTSILWNMSLGYVFLDENAAVKVNVYDLLDQNIDTRRTLGDDFIQDTRSLILTRYAMLSFTYKFNNFGGNPPRNGRGRSR